MYDEKSNLMIDCRNNAGDLQTMEAYKYQLIYKSLSMRYRHFLEK